jgi:hypothetical protein
MDLKTRRAPLESTIAANVRHRLLGMGCWLRKFSPGPYGYQLGTLDFIGIYRGLGFALEIKRPGPKHIAISRVRDHLNICPHCIREMTPAQRAEVQVVRAAGGLAHVVTSADEAEIILTTYYRLISELKQTRR